MQGYGNVKGRKGKGMARGGRGVLGGRLCGVLSRNWGNARLKYKSCTANKPQKKILQFEEFLFL